MRLIDADELQQLFNDVATNLLALPELTKDAEHMVRAFLMVTEMIQDAPTVEVEPVIAENATLKAERDAAVEDMTKLVKKHGTCICDLCRFYDGMECGILSGCSWEWRGVTDIGAKMDEGD